MQEEPSEGSASFSRLIAQSLLVLCLGTFFFFFLWLAVISIDQVWYAGRVMPGISVSGISVGGLTREQAEEQIDEQFSLGSRGKLTLAYSDTSWQVDAAELGITLDASASARQAFLIGRSGPLGKFLAYRLGGRHTMQDLPAVIVFDQTKAYEYLVAVSHEYDQAVKEANLVFNGTQVMAEPGQIGRQMDIPASLERITDALKHKPVGNIQLIVHEQPPDLLDASPFIESAQQLLDEPFVLKLPQDQADSSDHYFSISPENLAPMLTFSRQQQNGRTRLVPQFQDNLLEAYLEKLADGVRVPAENPRFIFNDDTHELELLSDAIVGHELDIPASQEMIQSALQKGRKDAVLVVNKVQPEVGNDATASMLEIRELVHEESTYFFGSNTARINNIELAAEKFHGLLVPPGAEFSMASAIGDISLDEGYTEALIIYEGRTIEGVGGGVCQVSTTLFRAAFFAGFPISERQPHAYRVSYYEKTSTNQRDPHLAGLDATVFVPLVDLVFTNDTPYWLLMETYVNRSANRITWKFYSTSDGRQVEWSTTGPTNIVKPKAPLYKLNPELSSGEIKQVDWEAEGADVRVSRTVTRDGEIILEDTFFTRYNPWRAVYEYGPGTEGIPLTDEVE